MAPTPADDGRPAHDPYGPLRLPSYRWFLIASILASAGSQMQEVAVGWDLYKRTHNAFDLGLVGLVMVLPVLCLAIPAGQAADRYPKKRLILASQCLMVLASLALTLLSVFHGPIWVMYLALFTAGVANAINMPARWSILRQLVPDHLVGNAITWNSSGWQVASVVGPAVSGYLIGQTGLPAVVYGLDVVFSLTVIALIAGIKPAESAILREPPSFRSLLAGFQFVGSNRLILATITLDLFAVFLGGAIALLPIFAEDILKVGPVGLGYLRAAPSIGAAIMALTLAHLPPLKRAGPALLWAVGGFGVATIAFGFSTNPYLSFAMLFLTGALDNISVVVRSSLIQFLTPESMRGRVAAVNSVFIGSSNELGGFESGTTAKLLGPVASVVLGGIGTIISVVFVAAKWPEVARLGRLDDLATPDEPAEITSGQPESSLTAAEAV